MRHTVIAVIFFFASGALLSATALQDEKPPLLIVSKRTGNAEIYLVNAKGEGAKNLTNNKSENSYPAWSSDGKKIAYRAMARPGFETVRSCA